MPPVDADLLARLRVRYAPESEPPGVCVYCGGAPMLPDGGTNAAGHARWWCPRCGAGCVTPCGDPDVLTLLTAYEALVGELRRALAAARTGMVEDFQLAGRLIRLAESQVRDADH